MTGSGPFSLSLSFERHLRAKNLSSGTVASYLVGVRQFPAFLGPRGRELEAATRADVEAFIAELLTSRSAATASTRYKQLQALYRAVRAHDGGGAGSLPPRPSSAQGRDFDAPGRLEVPRHAPALRRLGRRRPRSREAHRRLSPADRL